MSVALLGSSLIGYAAPASATAVGYTVFGTVCIDVAGKQVCEPGKTLGHSIIGKGRMIKTEEAGVDDNIGAGTAGGNFCNWRIDYLYYDGSGRLYETNSGDTHWTCQRSGVVRHDGRTHTLSYYGKACAVFYVNNKELVRQCHYITK